MSSKDSSLDSSLDSSQEFSQDPLQVISFQLIDLGGESTYPLAFVQL